MLPVVFYVLVEISIIKVVVHLLSTIVVDFTLSMKLTLIPLTVVCDTSVVIVKDSLTVHGVVSPHAFVVSTVFVEKSAKSISLLIFHLSAVSSSVLVLFFNVDKSFILFLIFWIICGLLGGFLSFLDYVIV
jgi:hypothetical protein